MNIENTKKEDENLPTPTEQSPKGIQAMFQELELIAMNKDNHGVFDTSSLDKAQLDSLIDLVKAKENNAFTFELERLKAIERIESKKIDASIFSQGTTRYILISLALIFTLITLAVLFFKNEYLATWLTFVSGLAGGFGLGKIPVGKPSGSSKFEKFVKENSDNQ
jgi:hypothetical protein